MTAKIGIVGLGQIGASIGLALKAKAGLPELIGHDREARTARTAQAMGAVDSTAGLTGVVREAAIVFLCLPLSEMAETLKRIGPSLAEQAVVFDTAPAKRPVMAWVREYIPAGRHYVGLVPAVSNSLLAASERGIEGARADLFQRTIMMIVAPPDTPAEVEQLAVNMAGLLGAKAMLTDPLESDGIMTTAHLLPQLTASALVEATMSAPGWREARKLAGLPFAGVTGGMAYYDGPASLEVAALANREVVVHALDVLIAGLKGMRDDIDQGNEANVSERLSHSFQARERWLDERGSAAWLTEGGEAAELPGLGDQVMQMFFGSRIAERAKMKKQSRE
jgi:prephenate dehydrogenase